VHLQKKREGVKTNEEEKLTGNHNSDAVIQKPKRNKPVPEFLIQRDEAVSQIQEQAQRFGKSKKGIINGVSMK
jgi:hypothetical protein